MIDIGWFELLSRYRKTQTFMRILKMQKCCIYRAYHMQLLVLIPVLINQHSYLYSYLCNNQVLGLVLTHITGTRTLTCKSGTRTALLKPGRFIDPIWSNYLSLSESQLNHVSERGHWGFQAQAHHQVWWLQPQMIKFMGQHGAHLGPTGPRWAPCWPHEPCYQGRLPQ